MKIQKKFHKTLKNLNLSDMQPGQFLVNKNGEKCKVLGVCGEAIFKSYTNNFDTADPSTYTLAELKKIWLVSHRRTVGTVLKRTILVSRFRWWSFLL
jgi:calcineurin-like phosphoesterase